MEKRTCIITGILVFLLALSLVGNYRLFRRFTNAKQAHEAQMEDKVAELGSARDEWDTLQANITEAQKEHANLIAREEELLANEQERMAGNDGNNVADYWTLQEFKTIIDTYMTELSKLGFSEEEIAALVDKQAQQWVMYSQEALGMELTLEPKTGASKTSQSASFKTAKNGENTEPDSFNLLGQPPAEIGSGD